MTQHQIVKYKNRKIYSKKLKRYVTHGEIAKFILDGEQINAIAKVGGISTDITNEIKVDAIAHILKSDSKLTSSVLGIIKVQQTESLGND